MKYKGKQEYISSGRRARGIPRRALAWLVVLIVLFSALPALAAPRKQRLAILDLKHEEGVSPSVARTVSDFVREEMLNTGLFIVVEREQIDEVKKEQAFAKSGQCSGETECAIKIGQFLAAEKIMVGKVSRLGKKIYVSARIIDVTKGRVDFAEKGSARSLETLEFAVRNLSRKIAARITGRKVATVKPPATAETDRPETTKKEPEKRTPPGKRTRLGALWRSALIPGWGQYYSGSALKGGLFLGGMLAGAGLWSSVKNSHSAARTEFNRIASQGFLLPRDTASLPLALMNMRETQLARSRLNKATGRANLTAIILAGLYFYNLYDASSFLNLKSTNKTYRHAGSNSGASLFFDFTRNKTRTRTSELKSLLSIRWKLDW